MMFGMLAAMNMLLLAAFLTACTARVLTGGTGRVIPTKNERQASEHRQSHAQDVEAEARVGEISLEDDEQ